MPRDDETRDVPASDAHLETEIPVDQPRLPGFVLTPDRAEADAEVEDEMDLADEPEEPLSQRPWFRATLVGVGVVVLGVGALVAPSFLGGSTSTSRPRAGASIPAVSDVAGSGVDTPGAMPGSTGSPATAAPSAGPAATMSTAPPAEPAAAPPAPAVPPTRGTTGGPAASAPAWPPVGLAEKSPSPAVAPASVPPRRPARAQKVAARTAPSSALRTETPSGGRFWVQVGAFKDREHADRLMTRLARRGHSAIVVGGASTDAPHVVRVGSYATRRRALDVQTALKREGLDGFLVASAGS